MRLVFAGTPQFAQHALAALIDAGHAVVLVLTQPDRPAGRGLHETQSAVKRYAQGRGLELFQPATLRDADAVARVIAARPQALVVAAYGQILPQSLLDAAPFGALNIHASLLPRWRGAAPIQRALLAGDAATGISIMKMDAGLDTGALLCQRSLAILPEDDAGTLHDRLARLGAAMIVDALRDIESGQADFHPQPAEGVSYAHKLSKAETGVDWRRPARELHRVVRALCPSPGARASLRGETVKIWRASIDSRDGEPGTIIESRPEGIVVACGVQALALTELQRGGGRRLQAAELLRGWPLSAGERFAVAAR